MFFKYVYACPASLASLSAGDIICGFHELSDPLLLPEPDLPCCPLQANPKYSLSVGGRGKGIENSELLKVGLVCSARNESPGLQLVCVIVFVCELSSLQLETSICLLSNFRTVPSTQLWSRGMFITKVSNNIRHLTSLESWMSLISYSFPIFQFSGLALQHEDY